MDNIRNKENASNEAKYSGGYRSNVREDVQYSTRGQDHRWQEKELAHKSLGEDRRDVARLQKFDIPRASDQQRPIDQEVKRSRSRNRSSRSPRRDRSPVRDRYKHHSPSSRSPRRSWALEKRRSPEMREPPPPPIWPGQDPKNPNYQYKSRSKVTERDHEKTSSIWMSQDKKRDEFIRQRNADRENFEEEMKRRQGTGKWKPLSQASPIDRAHKEDKYLRKEFEERRDFNRDDDDDRKQTADRRDRELPRQDREGVRYKPDFEEKDTILRKKEDYSGRIEEKKKEILKKQEQLQKELDEVYKRAVDFTKNAELYRKGELKKDANYHSPRRREEDHVSSDSDDGYNEYSHKDRNVYSKAHFSKNEDFKVYEKSRHSSDEGKKKIIMSVPQIKTKRNTAIEQIAEKIMTKYGSHLPSDLKNRVSVELELSISKILTKMFGNEDISFIELVIKFNSQHSPADEEKIFDEVMSSFPTQYRRPKRSVQDDSGIPAKISRPSGASNITEDNQPIAIEQNWSMLPNVAANAPIPMAQVAPAGIIMSAPVMVPVPTQYQFVSTQSYHENLVVNEDTKKDGHNLYLCKDDFQPIDDFETAQLKNFLVQQLIKVTQTSQGWAPDFTLAKQQSTYRHEMITRDERSRDWLLSLDFSEFKDFRVLVYTTEELWYERAAIWLPGHSRYRNIDPLTKLKLQNKQLEGVNIGMWKFVKQIITEKGARVYVDMPPSSARALEKHKMQLSYELQKVNVFLKAVAIDKEAFDAGLNETSMEFVPTPGMTPMPSIVGQDKNIIKIAFKGNKPLSLVLARKVKDTIIYKMYKYHQLNGKSRTDYTKYGFCQPGYFCLLPENAESKKWICNLDLGKINRIPLIILGTDEGKTKFFNMSVVLPRDTNLLPKHACERLRQSNQGVKGINFNLWKNHRMQNNRKHNQNVLNVDMDLESIETIVKMKYRLDFIVDSREYIVIVESNLTRSKLEDMIDKYKAELNDKYDVANMEIASDSDDDIICLG